MEKKKHHGEIKTTFPFAISLIYFAPFTTLVASWLVFSISRLLFNFTAPQEWVIRIPLFLGSLKYLCHFFQMLLLFFVIFCIFRTDIYIYGCSIYGL